MIFYFSDSSARKYMRVHFNAILSFDPNTVTKECSNEKPNQPFYMILFALPKQKHTASNRIKKKTQTQTLIKWLLSGFRLWFWVLIGQLLHFFHPFPSFSDGISRHHAVISLFLPTFHPLQPNLPVKMCVCLCLYLCVSLCVFPCTIRARKHLSSQWPEESMCGL